MNTTPPLHEGTRQPPPRAPWRFVRREHGRMIAGVAAGMADAFGIDVMVMRVLWVVAALVSFGVGIAAYAICWLAFPSDEHPAPLHDIRHREQSVGIVVGLALLVIGALVLFGGVLHPFRRGANVVWATVLIGAGLAVLLLRHPDHDAPAPPPTPPTPPWATSPRATSPAETIPAPAAPDETPLQEGPTPESPTPESASTEPPPPTSTAWSQFTPWPTPPTRPPWQHPDWPHYPERPRRSGRRRRSFLTPLTLSVLLIGAGIVALLDNTGATHITVAETLAGAVAVIGLALVASAWFGRARGLIPIGIILLVATVPAAALDVPLTGGIGRHDYQPKTRGELRSRYELGIGRLEVDLLSVPLANHTTSIQARLGIGELVIDVPSSVRVVVHGHAGAGSVRVFGSGNGGYPENVTRSAAGTHSGELDITARVGAGDVQVRRFEPGGVETLIGGSDR